MFKYLDLVKVIKPDPRPGEVVILQTDGADQALLFYTGAVGRVIAKVNGGYKVWFPVPCFPDKGQAVDLAEKCLKLFHGATEKDYRAAHYPGMSASLPMGPDEAKTRARRGLMMMEEDGSLGRRQGETEDAQAG
jgi:hypothetical protein